MVGLVQQINRGRVKPNYASIPRIDWSHPLAQGLKFCAYSVAGQTIVDLVRGNLATFASAVNPPGPTTFSPYGGGPFSQGASGLSNGRCAYFTDNSLAGLAQSGAFSAFVTWYQVEASPASTSDYPTLFSLSEGPGTGGDVISLGFPDTDPTGWNAGGDGGGIATSPTGLIIPGNFYVGGCTVNASAAGLQYLNGKNTASGTWGYYAATSPPVYPTIFGWSQGNGQGHRVGAIVYQAMLWNRTLTPAEAELLSLDPYCFLIWPEDELFTLEWSPPLAPVGFVGGNDVQVLPFNDPFVYPAALSPGFDPSHPAARGIRPGHGFSGIAKGGKFIDLLRGLTGSNLGAPASVLNSHIGLATDYSSGGNSETKFSGNSTALDAVITHACVAEFPSISSSTQGLVSTGETSGGAWFNLSRATVASLGVTVFGGSSTVDSASAIQLVAKTPYLLIASGQYLTTGSVVNFLAKNLLTGQVQSVQIVDANNNAPATSDGTYNVGARPGQLQSAQGAIAAAMWSPTFLSMQELRAWADDPWAFWYPRKQFDLFSVALSPGAAAPPPPAAVGSTLTLMGVG